MNALPDKNESLLLKKDFGLTVKSLRKNRNLSQGELAARAGLHRTYVTDVERGARNLSLESIAKLARALGTSIADLFIAAPESVGAVKRVRGEVETQP